MFIWSLDFLVSVMISSLRDGVSHVLKTGHLLPFLRTLRGNSCKAPR